MREVLAPQTDLLAALKGLLKIVDRTGWGQAWAGRPHAEADAAIAAIATAEGRTCKPAPAGEREV